MRRAVTLWRKPVAGLEPSGMDRRARLRVDGVIARRGADRQFGRGGGGVGLAMDGSQLISG
jgi:hypothetical protein